MLKINYESYLIAAILIIGWIFGGKILLDGFFDLDKEWRTFIPILGLSIIGVFLYVLKRNPNSNSHWIDSMGMLIIGIGPVVTSFDLLPKDDFGRILMPVFTVIITVFWFLYFGFFIKPNKQEDPEKIVKEEQNIKQTKRFTLVIFVMLIILEIFQYRSLLEANKIL